MELQSDQAQSMILLQRARERGVTNQQALHLLSLCGKQSAGESGEVTIVDWRKVRTTLERLVA
jgi:hypothetical protein